MNFKQLINSKINARNRLPFLLKSSSQSVLLYYREENAKRLACTSYPDRSRWLGVQFRVESTTGLSIVPRIGNRRMINVRELFGAICTLQDLCWCRPFVLQCRRGRGSTTPRTIALRFYARGMAVNLYRITSRAPIIECGMWIESLAPVELRRVPDPCSGLTNSRIVSRSSLFSIEPPFHRGVADINARLYLSLWILNVNTNEI